MSTMVSVINGELIEAPDEVNILEGDITFFAAREKVESEHFRMTHWSIVTKNQNSRSNDCQNTFLSIKLNLKKIIDWTHLSNNYKRRVLRPHHTTPFLSYF